METFYCLSILSFFFYFKHCGTSCLKTNLSYNIIKLSVFCMPSVAVPKACLSIIVKEIPKSVGARMQPCFTSLQMSNASDVEPSYTMVPFMSTWKDCVILRSVGGQPIFASILMWQIRQGQTMCTLPWSVTNETRENSVHLSWCVTKLDEGKLCVHYLGDSLVKVDECVDSRWVTILACCWSSNHLTRFTISTQLETKLTVKAIGHKSTFTTEARCRLYTIKKLQWLSLYCSVTHAHTHPHPHTLYASTHTHTHTYTHTLTLEVEYDTHCEVIMSTCSSIHDVHT